MPLEKEHLKISIRQRNSGKELERLVQTMGGHIFNVGKLVEKKDVKKPGVILSKLP